MVLNYKQKKGVNKNEWNTNINPNSRYVYNRNIDIFHTRFYQRLGKEKQMAELNRGKIRITINELEKLIEKVTKNRKKIR
ncbi:unnamed protein product [marine sediment metagenome]|uniref:Uncharacterized protein n=1 Tax=marine sediment metagenome TaxID=412755 RepID=X1SEH7_9ZZZZ